MQWIALEGHNVTPASKAVKHKNYLCPECRSIVRLRAGFHRQRHFYHLQTPASCKQHQKTLEHLQTQICLAQLGKEQNSRIEQPFPEIGRIADIAFIKTRIVIEVQVSPISLEEVEARVRDYRSLGWGIVWILHDRTFNRRTLSPAEQYLRMHSPCYFTNIAKQGNGIFYDQFERFHTSRRIFRGPKLPVSPQHLFPMLKEKPLKKAPLCIRQRGENWSYFSQGDLFERWLKHRDIFEQKLFFFEKQIAPLTKPPSLFSILRQIYGHAIKKGAENFARKE